MNAPAPRRRGNRGSVVALPLPLGSGCVDLAAIETRPFVGIAEDGVGRRNALEPFFRLAVAGIEVGMKLLRQLAVRRADFFLAGVRLHAQDFVRIIGHVCDFQMDAFDSQTPTGALT